MKKLVLSLCVLFMASIVMAETYTVALATHTPTSASGQTDGTFPGIAGKNNIGEIIIANAGATIQTITVYKLSDSSTTAAAIATAVSPSTGTISIDLEGENVDKIAIIKSATGSVVTATVLYK